MNYTKGFKDLMLTKIYEIKYNRTTDINNVNYFNENNKVSNFSINFIKEKIQYEIENKSYEVINPKFSIEKKDNIFIENLNNSKIPSSIINKTFDSEIKKEQENTRPKYYTYNKNDTRRDNQKTIKIITQKRVDSEISTIKKTNNSFNNDSNLFNSNGDKNNQNEPDNNNNKNNKNINISKSNAYSYIKEGDDDDDSNDITNLKLLKTNDINNNEIRDENEFLNSINKSTILKINLHQSEDHKYNNIPISYDERGFVYNSNASYYDNDGVYFDEDGYDKNKGRHNRLGEYQPGPDFNEEFGMYNNDINNLSFDKDTLKKALDQKDEIEFQKLKMEGKESKKLQKDFQLPIEKDDSSDDLNIDEEFNMLDKSCDSEISFKQPENSKAKSNDSNDNMVNKFFNGELNEEIEKHLKDEEDREIQKNLEEIESSQNETLNELNILKDLKQLNNNYKIKTKKLNLQKNQMKRKSKTNNPNAKNKVNEKEGYKSNETIIIKENKSPKNNKKQSITKNFFKKFPDITEESLNKENDFEDIDSYITLKKIISSYSTTEAEKEDNIQELNKLVMDFKQQILNK